MTDKAYVKITMKDVYDKLVAFEDKNTEQHGEIVKRQDKTNGKVSRTRLIAVGAICIASALIPVIIFIIQMFLAHIVK